MRSLRMIIPLGFLFALLVFWQPSLAQSGVSDRPIDMLIVLDNSCSMFPKEMLVPGCTSFGSDVNFLRITGADLFLARLGFDQAKEEDYQVGVISLGDEPTLISPLAPLAGRRDELAALIANPAPEKATLLVPALQLAFDELTTSPNRKDANQPAVVLITDGVPYPPEGQSNTDIENLIQKYPEIPVFLMILKNTEANLEEFDDYVTFWQSMQQTYDNVFVYLIEQPDQIQDTYNSIVALLQDTIPTKGSLVTPGTDLPFYVSEYIDKVVITASYPPGSQKGSIRVIDPRGQEVRDGEPGVARFSGEQNPVEIISISGPRLADEYKNQLWKLQSDWVTNIFIDRLGAYQIQVDSPEVTPMGLKNVYLVKESQSPREEFIVRFKLVDNDGEVVLEAQPVWAEVALPEGALTQIPLATEAEPDENGFYEMRFDLPTIYPYVSDQFARFVFVIHAGSAGERLLDAIPIASARLLADVGPSPYIQLLNPSRIECAPGAAQKIQVSIGDYRSVISGRLAAVVSSPLADVALTGENGDLRGDLSELCQGLLAQYTCGQRGEDIFTLRIDAKLQEERPFQPIERLIPVQLVAPECTPLPTQTESAFILPTPRSTPVPDVDSDGYDDLTDACLAQPGMSLFSGCPAPTWFWITGVGLLVALLVFLWVVVWPRFAIRYVSPPPDVYIAVCTRDALTPVIYSIREAGLKRHSTRVRIGGDSKKADLYVSGLKPVEFTVDGRGDKIVLLDAIKGETKAVFRQLSAERVASSNPGILIWVAGKRSSLERVSC